MKKLVLAAAIGGIFAVPAYAQSSVTLYGIVDTGVTYVNNGGKGAVTAMQSGVAQGSRWGLKGTEDLGGGLKTVFQLENGFNVNNGSAKAVLISAVKLTSVFPATSTVC